MAGGMNHKKLAVIGGSYLQLPVVRKAKEMGLEVICFAWRDGAVCADYVDRFYPISIIEKELILERCREEHIDGITTIASDTAVVTVNYVATRMGLTANPDNYTAVTTNKFLMRRCFADNDIPSPRFLRVAQGDHYNLDGMRMPVIVKPTDRSGSRGVEKVLLPERMPDAIKRAQGESFEHTAIVEEFVEGCEVSVEAISFQGQHHILQITDKVTTGAPFFVELEHHQPSSLPADVQQRIRDIVRKALKALHIEFGASHSELKITQEGEIRIIEIGARMGGDFIGSDLVRLSTGYDFLRGVIEVALGEFHEPVLTTHRYSGVYFLAEETRHLKAVIERWKDYPSIVEAAITDDQLRNITCSADRSGYLIYQSDHKLVLP